MGSIKGVLALSDLSPRDITPNGIWVDVCENLHLHYRNIRLDFSQKEFSQFLCFLNQLHVSVNKIIESYKWKEGMPEFLVQAQINQSVAADSTYYPDRVSVELQRDNTVHLHYRDLRVHLSAEEFKQLSQAMLDASIQMNKKSEFPYNDATARMRAWVPIDSVQPYDEGHKPGCKLDKDHRDGVEICKQLIKDGKKIRPILVTPEGQRIDGFKRWLAQKELGKDKIEVVIDPFFTASISKDKKFFLTGGQHNMSFEDDGRDINEDIMQECPRCGCRRPFIVAIKDGGYSWCEKCGVFYTSWKNIETAIYNKTYLDRFTEYEKNWHYYDYAWSVYLPQIDALTGGKRGGLLDIGFVYPQIMDNAKRDGFSPTAGVDINDSCKTAVGDKHKLYIGDFCGMDITEKYDVVWASHVFEHFKNPWSAMEKAAGLLNKGGCMFLSMPDPSTISSRNVADWGHWKTDEHHVLFPIDAAKKMLEDAGMEIMAARHNTDGKFICVGDYHILARKK